MAALDDLFGSCALAAPPRPWPRISVDRVQWQRAAVELAEGRWTLVALWAQSQAVHMAIWELLTRRIAILSLACTDGCYRGRLHPAAIRLERAIHDLVGLSAEGCPDLRPWLDHGRWSIRHPFSGERAGCRERAIRVSAGRGANLHQIPVGPVHGIIEPGHFRSRPAAKRSLVSRSGSATCTRASSSHGRARTDTPHASLTGLGRQHCRLRVGFCTCSRGRHWRRGHGTRPCGPYTAELERLANHLGDIGAVCNDAAFALMQTHMAALRERILRSCQEAFGHRLMMDAIVPGGLARDIGSHGERAILSALDLLETKFPKLVELYDNTPSPGSHGRDGLRLGRAGEVVRPWRIRRSGLGPQYRRTTRSRVPPL